MFSNLPRQISLFQFKMSCWVYDTVICVLEFGCGLSLGAGAEREHDSMTFRVESLGLARRIGVERYRICLSDKSQSDMKIHENSLSKSRICGGQSVIELEPRKI